MPLQHLRDEIARPEYAGLSDQAVADAVNAKRIVVRRPVPTWLVRQSAIEAGYWPALVEARESSTPAIRSLAISVLAWIDDQSGTIQTVDLDRPASVAMRQQLVAAGLVTQAQADALADLGDTLITWAEANGLPEIGIGLIRNARRL